MANLERLRKSQGLQLRGTTGASQVPTPTNPVITKRKGLNFDTTLTMPRAPEAFDITKTTEPTLRTGNLESMVGDFGKRGAAMFLERGGSQEEVNRLFNRPTEPTTAPTDRGSYLAGQEAQEQDRYNKAKEQAKRDLLTKEEQIRQDLESVYAPRYTSVKEAGERERETAFRIAGRGAEGTKSATQQGLISDKQRQIEDSIAAEQRLDEEMRIASARGASADELESIGMALNNAKANRLAFQEEQQLRQAGLDEATLELANEREKQTMKDALEAAQTGFVLNPETGQYERDPSFTTPEDFDFSLQTDSEGNVTQIRTNKATGEVSMTGLGAIGKGTSSKFQSQFNPVTGEQIIFDPVSGKNISMSSTGYDHSTGQSGINVDPTSKGYKFRDEGGSQCAEGINDNSTGTFNGEDIHFGDSYDDKTKWIDDDITPQNVQPGNTLVMPMTVNGSLENGHVAFVTGKIGDKIYTDEFNRNGDEQFTSGVYTVDDLNQMQNQTGQKWGFAPTQFNEGIDWESGISKADIDRLIPKTDSEVVELAQLWGHDINKKGATANILSNYKQYGILPSNDRIKAVTYQASSNIAAIDALNDILEQATSSDTGFYGTQEAKFEGTSAYDIAALLDTVQATAAFDSLQSMRAASKTGGALGQVSERELALLIAAKGAMKQGQSFTQFKKNITKVRDVLIKVNKAAYEDLGMTVPEEFNEIASRGSQEQNEFQKKYNY